MIDETLADRIWELRVLGHMPRQIARKLNCTSAQVKEACAQHAGEVTNDYRKEVLAVDLQRLAELGKVFYAKAATGDYNSALVLIKLMERVAAYTALDAPQSMRINFNELPQSQVNRIDHIRQVIARLAPPPVAQPAEPIEPIQNPPPRKPLPAASFFVWLAPHATPRLRALGIERQLTRRVAHTIIATPSYIFDSEPSRFDRSLFRRTKAHLVRYRLAAGDGSLPLAREFEGEGAFPLTSLSSSIFSGAGRS
jgi:hypothetical protein